MQADPPFGKHYLQQRILSGFPLARHLGIVVDSADDAGVVLHASLEANANHQGTAFGGSLFSVAVLTGWAWAIRYLAVKGLVGDAVIQHSTIRYLVPVRGTLNARLVTPATAQTDKFDKMLRRAGRGRIRLKVDIHYGGALATEFEGDFAAAIR